LIFNEGYAATAGDDWMRPELAHEAMRLSRMLAALAPAEPEVLGLQALLEIQGSRMRARINEQGEPVLLEAQDRSRWDPLLIRRGLSALRRAELLAASGRPVGKYFLQASIASVHARANRAEDTDWRQIAALYDLLADAAPQTWKPGSSGNRQEYRPLRANSFHVQPRRFLAGSLAVATLAATAFVVGAAASPPPPSTTRVFANAGGEPNVTVSPSGRYVLADGLGGASPSTLYRSTDYGRHFALAVPKVPRKGGGDWDMHFVTEKTVIAVDLSLGTGIYVDVSRDAGATWTQSTIDMDVYDRPWVGAKGNNLYVVAKGFDSIPYLYSSH